MTYQLMRHQKHTTQLYGQSNCLFDQSEAGTGKTLPGLHAWAARRRKGGGRLLVFAPKTCVSSVWIAEIAKFFASEFMAAAALAPKRAFAFDLINDAVVTNHDSVKWIMEQPPATLKKLLFDFDTVIWDESDALRHNSARTKAALKLSKLAQWKHKACFSATPFNKSVSELFYQVKFLDGGARLGTSFYRFRGTICEPTQIGPSTNHIRWDDKPDAPAAVAGIIQDITVRHELAACVEMPDITHRTIPLDLPAKLMGAYQKMRQNNIIELQKDVAVGVNAAVVASKLLQICSGSLYGEKETHIIDTSRAELAIELAREARPTVIFFNYHHQLEALQREAKKAGLLSIFIDGTVNTNKRAQLVELFQSGVYDVFFLQINSAAHGITLTNSQRAVFMTPPYSPSLYKQAFARIYRKGQKHKCESILLAANNTLETRVVQTLISRGDKQDSLLELLT